MSMLTITETAREQFEQLLQENPEKFLRVVFEGFGWGGPSLGLVLDELKDEKETVAVNGIDLMIAENVVSFTEGHEIDYIKNDYAQGFSIAPTTGGCCWFSPVFVKSL